MRGQDPGGADWHGALAAEPPERLLWCVGTKYPSCEVFVMLITKHDVLEARLS